MATFPLVLRDADEIEQFFLATTGMKPGYMQLSRGLADLRMRVVELDGVTLVWTRARGRARWRDQMTGDGLHIGFAIESTGPIRVRGHDVARDEAQIWMPDQEMDLVLDGPNLTLDIGIDAGLVEELGWDCSGEALRKVAQKPLARLVQTCNRVTETLRGQQAMTADPACHSMESLRDCVLDDLEPVLQPWLAAGQGEDACRHELAHFRLVARADEFFDRTGIGASFEVERLAASLGVSRRTVFHAFRKLLGVGPRRYLELKRLHALRARLRRQAYTDTSVANEASQLGFSDMGRLAASYQAQFGERPSETLRYG